MSCSLIHLVIVGLIVVIILILFDIRSNFTSATAESLTGPREYQGPGFGAAGVHNQQFRTSSGQPHSTGIAERFYDSGARLRTLPDVDEKTQQTIDTSDFNNEDIKLL